jgi:arsenate reductase
MRVLYVCVGNAARSQMAEAITLWLAEKEGLNIEARSAGTMPASAVSRRAKAVLEDLGISWNGVPKPLTDALADWADLVVLMGCDVCPALPAGKRVMEWGLPDPIAMDTDFYRRLRDEILDRVRREVLGALSVSKGES